MAKPYIYDINFYDRVYVYQLVRSLYMSVLFVYFLCIFV